MTELFEVKMYADLIATVESSNAVFGFEFLQLTQAVHKFYDYLYERRWSYFLSVVKLNELKGYIDLFPEPKFGDIVKSSWQNNLVEAIRVLGDLVDYRSFLLYKYREARSPSLFKTWLASDSILIFPPCTPAVANYGKGYRWGLHTYGIGCSGVEIKAASEYWFHRDQHYDDVTISMKAYIWEGKDTERAIAVLLISSGEPKKVDIPAGEISTLDRVGVDMTLTVDAQFELDRVAGQEYYEASQTFTVNNDIKYVALICVDEQIDSTYWLGLNELWVHPA